MSHAFKSSILACAMALALPSQAFDGQPPGAQAKPGAPIAAPLAAQQGLATGYNPGAQNAPNSNAAVLGGVSANQLSADNDALDKLLHDAIDNGNIEDVKAALKAGVSLKFDWTYGCPLGKTWSSDTDSLDEKTWRTLGSYKASLTDGSKSQGDLLNRGPVTGGGVLASIPSSCKKAHVEHAFLRLFFKTTLGGNDHDERFNYTELDYDRLVEAWKHANDGRDPGNNIYNPERAQSMFARRLEILMLLDADTPPADKVFYPVYLDLIKDQNEFAPRQWAAIRWLVDRYLAAGPDIEKARMLREPGRLAWDKILSTATTTEPYNVFSQKEMQAFKGSGAPSSLMGAHPALGQALAQMLPNLAIAAVRRVACPFEANIKNLPPNPDTTKRMPSAMKYLEFAHQYFDDTIGDYAQGGLARTSPAKAIEQYWAGLYFGPQKDRPAYGIGQGDIDAVVKRHTAIAMATWILSTPEIKASLEAQIPKKILGLGLGLSDGFRPRTEASGPMIRVFLGEGLIDPGLRDRNGKTPTDYALGADHSSPLFQAFSAKDYKGTGCDGKPIS